MKQLPIFIFSILLAVGASGGYVYMLTSIQTAVDQIAIAREDSRIAEERGKLVQAADVFIADTVEVRGELDTFVTKDAEFVSAIELLESAGKREKVEVIVGSVTLKKGDQKFHDVTGAILSAKGSFAGLAAFASALESLPLASRVTSISLESSSDNSWFGTFNIEFVKRKSL